MKKEIMIDSFNPYSQLYPNRRLVDKGTLELIKYLRIEGYNVIVKPENDQPVQYIFKKGFHEFFADPVYMYFTGAATSIITTLVTNSIQKIIDKWRNGNTNTNTNNIIIINNSTHETINFLNKHIPRNEIADKRRKVKKKIQGFTKCFSKVSPFPELPTPIFLEHKPMIVGWGRLNVNNEGLVIEKSIIIDKNVRKKIKSGKIKGASVTGISEKSICNICKSNYVECNHIAGDIYNNIICANELHDSTFVEVSLVNIPINEKCIIQML